MTDAVPATAPADRPVAEDRAAPATGFTPRPGPAAPPPPEANDAAPERVRFSLVAKLGLLLAVAAVVAAQGVGVGVVGVYERELVKREDAGLVQQEQREAEVLRAAVQRMVADVRFLARTPPVQGIARARAAGGRDPLDGSTEAVWRARLTDILTALAATRPDDLQLRYIAAGDGGREIVRVDQAAGRITVVPADALQAKGGRPYVRNALALGVGKVRLSPIELNQENGKVTPGHVPVLRASTAVAGPDGAPFGVVVINMDFQPVLDRLAAVAPRGTTVYVTDEQGEFLLHPDPSRAFAFDLGRSARIQERYPSLAPLFVPGDPTDTFTTRVENEAGGRTVLHLARIHFDPDDPQRFLALALAVPEAQTHTDVVALRYRAIGTVLALTGAVTLGVLVVGLVLIRPLRHMTRAVAAFPRVRDFPLPTNSRDEIGALARTFQRIRAERLRDEARLNAALDDLTRSNRELDDFAYIASHDLKEPLRGIHNYATFLLEDYADRLDDEGRDKLHTLTRLTQRLETLIDTLLHFSRVGRAAPELVPTDLDAELRDVLDTLHASLEERGVTVRVPRPLPTVPCDRARIGEVFRNLIANAAKYNDKPDKWVEVGWEKSPSGPVFYVRDNGIGIRRKHQDAVFRIFKRLHGRDRYGGGTGAGLTIAKKIVEMHGGRIWLESEPGAGTTFHFTLRGDPT